MNTFLWITFISLQILGAGHINYQQSEGYYEINPAYSAHPSKEKVYLIKAVEVSLVYGATKVWPKWEKRILGGAILTQVAFFVYDNKQGIEFKFKF